MGKDKKTELEVVKSEKSEGQPVLKARVWCEEGTGMYGLELEADGLPEGAEAIEWPTAWMTEESAQALADALYASGIKPSHPTDIVSLLQKELEDAKDFSRDLMDVLKAGREG